MSGDWVTVEYSEKYEGWWGVWGNETFYDDETRELLTWPTYDKAIQYIHERYPWLLVDLRLREGK